MEVVGDNNAIATCRGQIDCLADAAGKIIVIVLDGVSAVCDDLDQSVLRVPSESSVMAMDDILNPKGIPSQSPGLPRSGYPGNR